MPTLLEDYRDTIIHGAAVLAEVHGQPFFAANVGYAEAGHVYPMTADTVIDIASVSKMVTAVTALLICHSRGLIDFDAPFTEYLPAFTAPLKATVRVRDLANHTSGFGDVPGRQRLYFAEDGQQMLRNILVIPPPYAPTAHAQYACWNYLLLAKIIEQLTGEPLPVFCQREIFLPLEMDSTRLGAPPAGLPQERLAQTFGTPAPGVISDFVAYRVFRDGGTTANAGVFSTARDLTRFLRCYLRHGELPDGRRLFSEKSFAEIIPDHVERTDGYRRFGWIAYDAYLDEAMSSGSLLHSGWSGQTILFHPEKDFSAVVLTTRCGDYERCKVTRFATIARIFASL